MIYTAEADIRRQAELARCNKTTLLGHIRGLDPWNLNPYEKWSKDELVDGIMRREQSQAEAGRG